MTLPELKTVARIRSDFPSKFGIPRQSGLVEELESLVVFEPEFRRPEALRGLEGFSHLWLLWLFSQVRQEGWSPTVRPPRLGGNARLGVFATRSPYRPNPIGLSCVRLVGLEEHAGLGTVLRVAGADLMDGTPILDVKPYLPYADCRSDAVGGFAAADAGQVLTVDFPDRWLALVPPEKRNGLKNVLSRDPRPPYQRDSERIYGLSFGNLNIRFTVKATHLTVIEVKIAENGPF